MCLIGISAVNYILKDNYQYIIIGTIILSSFAIEFGAYHKIYKYAKSEN